MPRERARYDKGGAEGSRRESMARAKGRQEGRQEGRQGAADANLQHAPSSTRMSLKNGQVALVR